MEIQERFLIICIVRFADSADYVGGKTVFNIKGNNFRLITTINFTLATVFVQKVLTHAEYSKEKWK